MSGLRCGHCAFDSDRWTDGDLLTTLPIVDVLVQEYVAGLDDATLRAPDPHGGWSMAEHIGHIRESSSSLHAPGNAFTAEDRHTALQVAHVATHHLHDLGRTRFALGAGSPSVTGAVTALHRSGGGVPKHAVDEVEVTWTGVVGDAQSDRKHHGRPFQALCLWGTDVIEALRAEGHPIEPGLAGENVTVAGVDWTSLRPGTLVQLGEVTAEISSYSTPCAKNAGWFLGGDFTRMDHDRHPGWSRLYAWVLVPGVVRVGDAVEVEPAV